jgi:hypothetical protein
VAAAGAGVKPYPSLPTQTKDAMGIGPLLHSSPAFTAMCMCMPDAVALSRSQPTGSAMCCPEAPPCCVDRL